MLEMLCKEIDVNLNLISFRITFISCNNIYGYLIFKTTNITVLQKKIFIGNCPGSAIEIQMRPITIILWTLMFILFKILK